MLYEPLSPGILPHQVVAKHERQRAKTKTKNPTVNIFFIFAAARPKAMKPLSDHADTCALRSFRIFLVHSSDLQLRI